MGHTEKGAYETPGMRTFANPEEVWAYYRDKGTPFERARLRHMLGLDKAEDPTHKSPVRRTA